MWDEDEWYLDLAPLERYLFIYLFSNPLTSPSGLYRLPMRTMAFHTGLEPSFIEAALAKFASKGKAFYADGVVFVTNMLKRNMGNLENPSNKLWGRVKSDIISISDDCRLKWYCVERLPVSCTFKAKLMASNPFRGSDAPCMPLEGASSVSPEQYHEHDHDHEHEQSQYRAPSDNGDGNGDGLATPEEYTGPNPESGNAWSVWQQARGGATNTLDDQRLGDLVDEFSEKWVVDAILEANASRTRGLININFVQTILDRWKAEGYKAPRGSPVARADEDAAKRAQANVTRKELYAQNVPRDEVEARIVEFYGQGY